MDAKKNFMVLGVDKRYHDCVDIVKVLTCAIWWNDEEYEKHVEWCFMLFYENAMRNMERDAKRRKRKYIQYCVVNDFLSWIVDVGKEYGKKFDENKFMNDIKFLNIIVKFMVSEVGSKIIFKHHFCDGECVYCWHVFLFALFEYITDGGVYCKIITKKEAARRFECLYQFIVDKNNELYHSYGLVLKQLMINLSLIYRKGNNYENIISAVELDVHDDRAEVSVKRIVSEALKC